MELKEIISCEVCGGTELYPVLDLGNHPLCDDLIPVGQPEQCTKYPIEIVYCKNCDTAHQKYQVPKVTLFPQTYHYRSRFTADVLSGMETLVDTVEAQLGSLEGLTVLDIGCNDGSLLDKFVAKGVGTTIGVEPTGAYSDAEGRNHIVINDYFSDAVAQYLAENQPKIDVITFTNVFAHIEDLTSLLAALKLIMHEKTVLVVENHYLGAVLEKNQFDTFYHEHPRTYSLNSFSHIADALEANILSVDFPSRYGGNIRVMISQEAIEDQFKSQQIKECLEKESQFFDEFESLREFVAQWKERKSQEIKVLYEKHGSLIAKAFPGRSAILIECLDLDETIISAVYEKPGSMKLDNYIPGTRIPIKSDDDLFALDPAPEVIINLAWHISAEINRYFDANGYKGKVVDILDMPES